MYVNFKQGAQFVYTCRGCGYRRPGVLDDPTYSTQCPECGSGYAVVEASPEPKTLEPHPDANEPIDNSDFL